MSHITHRRTLTRGAGGRGPMVDEEDIRMVRRKLEFHMARDDAEEDTSCWASTWKSIATLILTCTLMVPFLYASYNRYLHHQRTSLSDSTSIGYFMAADQLPCAQELNITYSKLFLDALEDQMDGLCRDQSLIPCECTYNPTVPIPHRFENRPGMDEAWAKTFQRNQQLALSAGKSVNFVFLGDSITEGWIGTKMANPTRNHSLIMKLWNDLFQDRALALGISGDRTRNLLYRLHNGEMPDSLNPAAWWILIGTNDYSENCCREAILLGQMAVLNEIRKHKPHALVILQGLLPRGDDNLLESSIWQDFQWINDRLACLSELPQLDFFNGTSIFLSDDEQHVNQTLMDDFLHPSLEGRHLWGLATIQRMKQLGIW